MEATLRAGVLKSLLECAKEPWARANFVFDDEQTVKSSCLDVNAREFVPKNLMLEDEAAASGDDVASTHSSNSLSASAKEFIPSKLPVEEDIYEGRNCARCNKLFYVFRDTGECVNLEECLYHWGKARSSRKYSCCGRRSKSGMSYFDEFLFYSYRYVHI